MPAALWASVLLYRYSCSPLQAFSPQCLHIATLIACLKTSRLRLPDLMLLHLHVATPSNVPSVPKGFKTPNIHVAIPTAHLQSFIALFLTSLCLQCTYTLQISRSLYIAASLLFLYVTVTPARIQTSTLHLYTRAARI